MPFGDVREGLGIGGVVVEIGGEMRSTESRGSGVVPVRCRVGEGDKRLGNTRNKDDPNGEESRSSVEFRWLK